MIRYEKFLMEGADGWAKEVKYLQIVAYAIIAAEPE